MKLLFFDDFRLGVLNGTNVVDVSKAVPIGDRQGLNPVLFAEGVMESVIERFDELRPKFEQVVKSEQGVPVSSVKIRPPLPRPNNALCAFSNFQDAPQKAASPLDFFHKSATSIVGNEETVHLPDIPEATVFQPEPEFAYVMGRPARMVKGQDALNYVFGYVNFVDISARGIPNRRTTFFHKALETWAPIGPVITTADEVPDPMKVQVRLWLNGDLKQDYNTSAMTYSIMDQIEWLSTYLTLRPGDVVSCGVHHVGLTPINDGDEVEVEGENLERLRFKVRSYGPKKTAHWRPPGVQG
jgi:2-keto-4-pentenoate hydratase/2-oxohepta-3-ene-1,7-dioic acid hydratase in catechol pathway